MLQDVITKFKKERLSLKNRIGKLESRMNAMTYDPSLDVKPAKGGAKSTAQDWLAPENKDGRDFDSKSEMGAKSVGAPAQQKKRKANHQQDDQLDIEAVKQEKNDKHESQSASGNDPQTKGRIDERNAQEESKSVSFAD